MKPDSSRFFDKLDQTLASFGVTLPISIKLGQCFAELGSRHVKITPTKTSSSIFKRVSNRVGSTWQFPSRASSRIPLGSTRGLCGICAACTECVPNPKMWPSFRGSSPIGFRAPSVPTAPPGCSPVGGQNNFRPASNRQAPACPRLPSLLEFDTAPVDLVEVRRWRSLYRAATGRYAEVRLSCESQRHD